MSTVRLYVQSGALGLVGAGQFGTGRKIRGRLSPRHPFCQSAPRATRSGRRAAIADDVTVGPTPLAATSAKKHSRH